MWVECGRKNVLNQAEPTIVIHTIKYSIHRIAEMGIGRIKCGRNYVLNQAKPTRREQTPSHSILHGRREQTPYRNEMMVF